MPANISTELLIEKNKIDTVFPWITLLEFRCNNAADEVVRMVKKFRDLYWLTEKYYGTSILRHFKCDDDSGDSGWAVEDSSPNLGHAVANRATDALSVTGKIDDALDNNGTTDYIDAGADSDMLVSTFSVSIWIRADEKDAIRTLIARHADVGDWWQLIQRSDGIRFELHNGTSQFNSSYIDTYTIDTWVHFVITMDAVTGVAKLYYNKVLVDTITDITDFDMSHGASLMIGSADINFNSGAEELNWKGPVDNVVYFEKVITLAEVELLYNGGNGTAKLPALYTSFPFSLSYIEQNLKNDIPTNTLSVSGITPFLHQYIEDLIDEDAEPSLTLTIIHADNLHEDYAELETIYDVLAMKITEQYILFNIGGPSPLLRGLISQRYYANFCPYPLFKGPRCQYVGVETVCPRRLSDCRDRNNSEHFGGFPSLHEDTIIFL